MTRAAAYLRVSTENQAKEDRFGLEVQLNACTAYAKAHGLSIAHEYSDTITGTKATRLHLERLLENAGQYDAVIVSSVDRLARRVHIAYGVLGELLESGLEVHSADMGVIDPEDDMSALSFGFRALFSDADHRKIAKRLSAGIIQKVRSGKPVVPLSNFGWHRGVIQPLEVERVIWLFEQAEHRSLDNLARELNTLQIPTPSGKGRWQNSNIQFLLRNTVYKGEYQYGRKRKRRPGTRGKASCAVEPLVSEEQWERTNKALDSRMRNRGQHGVRRDVFPLMGRIRCASCGAAMSGVQNGKGMLYYQCHKARGLQHSEPCLHKRLYHAPKVHARVRVDLERLVLDDAALKAAVIVAPLKALDFTSDRLKLERRLENAVRMRVDGEITREELNAVRADVDTALERMTADEAARLEPVQRNLKAVRRAVREVLQSSSVPLFEVADALRLIVRVAPDGSKGKQSTLAGTYSYELDI